VTTLSFAQNNLQDLVGDKATYLEQSMRDNGYKFISTSKGGDSSYQNYYNSGRNKCVTVKINDGRIESIVNSSLEDCGKVDIVITIATTIAITITTIIAITIIDMTTITTTTVQIWLSFIEMPISEDKALI